MKRNYQSITIVAMLLFSFMAIATHNQAAARGLPQASPADCAPIWSVVPSPNAGANGSSLQAVAAISSSDIWAVGAYISGYTGTVAYYSTLTEHWNGTSWSVISSPNAGTYAELFGITTISPSSVWAVGDFQDSSGHRRTLVEHWDGTIWHIVPSPNPDPYYSILHGVTAVSANDVWAVGEGSAYSTLTEHWDGSSWTIVASPNSTSNSVLLGATSTSASDVWAVGYSGGTLTEHWNGSNWTVVTSPNPGSGNNLLLGVTALSSSDVWAVGYSGASTLTEHWDGSTWTALASSHGPGIVGNQLNSVSAIAANDIWAVGSSSYNARGGSDATLVTHWDGTSWSLVTSPSPGPNADLNGVAAVSSSDVWAVGHYNSSTGNSNTLVEHYSTLGCSTITPTISPSPQPTACPNLFVDINTNIFFHAINSLYCQGVINGTDASHYSPSGTATRGQFAKLVALAFGLPLTTPSGRPTFTDVPPGYFAYAYIESGYYAGILSGFDAVGCAAHNALYPCYLPNLAITRGQLTKLVVNAGEYALLTPASGPTFTDVPPSNVFYAFIETAAANHIIAGYPDGSFRPNNPIRRDEMAQIVYAGQQNQPASPTPINTPAPSMTATPSQTSTPFTTNTPGGPTNTATPTSMPSVTITPTPGLARF